MKLIIFKTITNIVFYSGVVLGIFLVVAIMALSIFPENLQSKIPLPVNLNINDVNMTVPQVNSMVDLESENITSFQITYLTKDLSIVRILLLYYFIIMVGILLALFFWKKILTAYQKSTFFSQENRTIVNYLGGLLIAYFPLLYLINLFFETLINLQIDKVSASSSLYQGLDIGIILVVLGSEVLFIGKIVNKRISV